MDAVIEEEAPVLTPDVASVQVPVPLAAQALNEIEHVGFTVSRTIVSLVFVS